MAETVLKGAALGFHGPMTVSVGVDAGKICSLDYDYAGRALVGGIGIDRMCEEMLATGSADVDAVTGATFSSTAFKNAVQKALAVQDGKLTADEAANPAVANPYAPTAATDAVTSASVGVMHAAENTSPVTEVRPAETVDKFDKDYDVVIVGSGGAGLSAAVEAARAGLSVFICEKAGIFGGTTNLSGGVVQAAGTPYQKQLTSYQDDTPEKHAALWLKAGENLLDEELVKDLANGAPHNIEWLSDLGIKWTEVYGHTHIPYVDDNLHADRIHVFEGGGGGGAGVTLTRTLLKAALAAGATIQYNTTVKALVQETDSKKVVGVVAEVAGKEERIAADKGVILATASVDNNPALAKEFNPQQYNDLAFSSVLTAKTDTGDGILMGLSAGAAVMGMGGTIDFCGKTGNATNNKIPTIPMIIINGAGQRFVCEDATYAYQYRSIFQQEKQLMASTYMIFDRDAIHEPGSAWTDASLQDDVTSGLVIKAENLSDLAERLHVPVNSLASTIAAWNRSAAAGVDERFGRRTGLKPLKAPFFAYKNVASNLGSLGGLKINVNCQVLTPFGKVIPGLFAAGLNAGGWIAGYYPGSGTAISGIVHQGRKAAQFIASH